MIASLNLSYLFSIERLKLILTSSFVNALCLFQHSHHSPVHIMTINISSSQNQGYRFF